MRLTPHELLCTPHWLLFRPLTNQVAVSCTFQPIGDVPFGFFISTYRRILFSYCLFNISFVLSLEDFYKTIASTCFFLDLKDNYSFPVITWTGWTRQRNETIRPTSCCFHGVMTSHGDVWMIDAPSWSANIHPRDVQSISKPSWRLWWKIIVWEFVKSFIKWYTLQMTFWIKLFLFPV